VRVDRLELEDWRNYEHAEVDFAPGLNVIVGRNAQGKTNLLEGIYYLGGLGSPRSGDADLVRSGTERALVHADVVHGARALHIDLEIRQGRGVRALINRTPVPGARALREVVVAVFFGPDDLALIKGAPDGRRRFVDDLVVKLRPVRDGLRREWERVLKQRNALLKSAPRAGAEARSARQTLEVWDESLCRVGADIVAARLEALAALLPHMRKHYEAVAGGGNIELTYDSGWLSPEISTIALHGPGEVDAGPIESALRAAVDDVRSRELERGVSLVGPHRDDVAVGLLSAGGASELLDARQFASQGDQRTVALAMRLAEYDLLTAVLGEEPILLLDDVFSELDPARRNWLTESVKGRGQTFVSSAEADPAELRGIERVVEVTGGRVSVRA
jgi:DNA replication and repair protein RecF